MKRFAVLILVLLLGSVATKSFAQKKEKAVICFKSNMDCADCEKTLYEHLKFEKGVKDLKIDHASNTIYIEYAGNKNDEKGLAGAIEKKGYKAEKIDNGHYTKLVADTKKQGHEHNREVHKEHQ